MAETSPTDLPEGAAAAATAQEGSPTRGQEPCPPPTASFPSEPSAPGTPLVNSRPVPGLAVPVHLDLPPRGLGGSGASTPVMARIPRTALVASSSCTPSCTPMLEAKIPLDCKLPLESCSTSLSLPLGMTYAANMDSKSETNSLVVPICRICHMPAEEGDSEILISPCRCSGSLQFIHNTCLMKWLEIMTKKSRKPPKCELCHYQYHRHKKFKFHHWRLPRVSRQDKILHVIFIINLLIMIGCAVATVMCFLSDKGQITKFPRNKADLTTEELVTLSCGVLFFVSFFIAMSVQIKAKHTIYQLFVKFIMQNMEWEIDEYDKSKDSLYKDSMGIKTPVYV